MKIQSHKTERIHSLDSLRAIMMLLGLVIHSAITYGVWDYGSSWPLKDVVATHISNDFIGSFVHAFRMQIFFVVAGFFGAMLFYERQPLKMVKNRVSRIVFPFIVFLFLLWPTIIILSTYTNLSMQEVPNALESAAAGFSTLGAFIPERTFHLWFLYYLALITFFSVAIGLVLKKLPVVSGQISNAFSWVIQKPILKLVVFSALMCIVYAIMGTSSVSTSLSFVPDLNTFLYYTFFYFIGWVLFKSKHLLDTMMQYDWIYTILGITLFTVHFFINDTLSYEMGILMKSVMVWAFIFGITGLFIRFGSNHSSKMRYISDSSYWVYLIHLSLTLVIPSFIADWPLPATFKFLFVLISTGVICFTTYHYLVRGTFIGKFLNGRKYTRKLSDIKKAEETSKLKLALDK